MIPTVIKASLFLLLLVVATNASANTVQSSVVSFPFNGRVIIQAREEVGKFPQMLFTAEKKGQVLLQTPIKDKENWLIPLADESEESRPNLRYCVVNSSGIKSPTIMAVGLFHGGSDDAFFLTVFREVNGRIRRLNSLPFFTNVQGGFYWGYLGKKYGYGLAVWNFIWGHGINESHYSEHKYTMEIYRLKGSVLRRAMHRVSRKMYDSDRGSESFKELGIKVFDQRNRIPLIKEFVNVKSD